MPKLSKVLIANRGEIACRIIRTLRRLGIESVAVYSEADRDALHVRLADEAVLIGPPPARESYLDANRILEAARETGAQAIHPGYGFLSENADFAEACEAAGVVFIGPTPKQMRDFGLKHTARELAMANDVPLLPGTGLLSDLDEARSEAERIGYPVMLKSTAGGGGIGMQLCRNHSELDKAFESIERLSRNNFSNGGLYLEKFVSAARHVEVQIFGDGQGSVAALGERDCTLQRRNQKVVEETPAPGIDDSVRKALWAAAVRLAQSVAYRSAGTVEFILDRDTGAFYFLEVNTRLQVEHGVTEKVTGLDLVEWMIKVAADEALPLDSYRHKPHGHSIQVRVYSEDPGKNFQPSAGLLTNVQMPTGIRCDSWIESGLTITPYYDPLLAKLIVHAESREEALEKLQTALSETRIDGLVTNLDYLLEVLDEPEFRQAAHTTGTLSRFVYQPWNIDVLAAGTQTTIQDYPGRGGYWAVGVPPSGPMDTLSFRLGNSLLQNPESAAGLEIIVAGPTLRFNTATTFALTGAEMEATLAGQPVPFWEPVAAPAGSVLKLGRITGHGARTYVLVKGGFDVPDYLGSKSTFTLGKFGGHGGRELQVGDVLHLLPEVAAEPVSAAPLVPELRPAVTDHWEIGVLYGPHGAPDFFTENDIETLFATDWQVHYNSNRTGVRLIGPKPEWARHDGGEAGLHPSNIHDNAYVVGTIDFTGDMPIILGPDGPSLGGFVCPATIVQAELWKIGQLMPGNTVRFRRLTLDQAHQLESLQNAQVATLEAEPATEAITAPVTETASVDGGILKLLEPTPERPAVCYRQDGDRALLIEYGPIELDLALRFRVHALMSHLEKLNRPEILDVTPGIRSLQIRFDSRRLSTSALLDILVDIEEHLPDTAELEVPTRVVHLPLSWEDPSTLLAISKYMQSVRKDAPWCPSNIEFIRRINGLDSIDEVRDILFNASYLVLGLGDVYLGAPVATPLDPRHRLVTTKYNPARTWTPENAVGIGGAYLCVYGMEGPGGYQFVGRTVQMWNTFRQTADFKDGKPWLLRFFDQIRFFPVSADEILQMRDDFKQGRYRLQVSTEMFRFKDYKQFLADNAESISEFRTCQRTAFAEERERWKAAGQLEVAEPDAAEPEPEELGPVPDGCEAVPSHVSGNIWKIVAQEGERIEEGAALVIVEAMKMEISVLASTAGVVRKVLCREGTPVNAGDLLAFIEI